MYLRRNFSSSGLVRLLGDLEQADALPAGPAGVPVQDFAEKLSQWVGVFEAGKLHAVHQAAGQAATADAARALPGQAVPLKEQLHQVRAILTRAITGRDAPDGRRGRLPLEQPAFTPEPEIDFAPLRQRYQDQQRNMELMIGPLRDNVRQVLSATSPRLRQLAALDAVWEQLLAVREQKLMSAVPARLRRRFERLRKLHEQPAGQDMSQDSPFAAAGPPGEWLEAFSQELQQVLLAELEARLEPVTGLIEAFEQEG